MTPQEIKDKNYIELVRKAMLDNRQNFEGTDKAYAINLGINEAVWNRIKKGDTEKVLSKDKWYELGMLLELDGKQEQWKTARTQVFDFIEQAVLTCKEHGTCMLLVDDCGIGKTHTAQYMRKSKDYENIFYLDCSQSKTKQLFVRSLARAIGVDPKGRYADVKLKLKHALNNRFIKPVIILDEVGDLEYPAFLEIKEFQNATDRHCGWFMMGADGLRTKIDNGIEHKKEGYREIFSRFGENYLQATPYNDTDKKAFMTDLVRTVLSVNLTNKTKVEEIVAKSRVEFDKIPRLRRARTLVTMKKD